jgi:hypothetical protein
MEFFGEMIFQKLFLWKILFLANIFGGTIFRGIIPGKNVRKIGPWGKIFCLPQHSSKQQKVFIPGGERRGEHSPWGPSSPLGARGEINI